MLIPLRMLVAALMLAAGCGGAAALSAGSTAELSYGGDPLQRVDFYPAAMPRAPLVIFIHGGAWSAGDKRQAAGGKPDHFTANGIAFASVNYRLVPEVGVAEQARDIARATAMLRRDAVALGFDPSNIVLMGHSAGAHLAALLATDPSWLRDAGVPFEAIRGAVLIDGAGYDITERMRDAGLFERRLYERAFGTDPETWRRLSPAAHTARPNAKGWLLMHVEQRRDSQAQADALAEGLRAAGSHAMVLGFDSTHARLNRDLGSGADPATVAVDAFLDSCFDRKPGELMGTCG